MSMNASSGQETESIRKILMPIETIIARARQSVFIISNKSSFSRDSNY